MGEFTIDLNRFGWFPDELPSESGLVGEEDEDDEGTEDEDARDAAAYHT